MIETKFIPNEKLTEFKYPLIAVHKYTNGVFIILNKDGKAISLTPKEGREALSELESSFKEDNLKRGNEAWRVIHNAQITIEEK